jgi:hypothetical protein
MALLSSSKRKGPMFLAKPENSINRCLIPGKTAGTDLQRTAVYSKAWRKEITVKIKSRCKLVKITLKTWKQLEVCAHSGLNL